MEGERSSKIDGVLKEPAIDDIGSPAAGAPRWLRTREVLDRALDLPPGERAAWLDKSCAGDEELRREVEGLLAVEEPAEGFLTDPLFSLKGSGVPETEDPNLGRVVGAYRLLRPLGRGGMGAVYLAERCDGQFDQTVAVKLIKRGMDTDEILRRFRNERQILAGLVHENIARVYDGGTTDDHLPYFVMEYVEGEPIDRWCDSRRRTVTERLRLFLTVCRAVQAAHQNLIVHRDLKPANILIATDGTPKLLDFGIAKLLAPEAADGPGAATELGWLPLTPAYASPEQLRGESVTTASDVYSLGVLLYELLTGRLPHDAPTGQPHLWERSILEEEPLRPSLAVRRPRELRRGGGDGDVETVTPEQVAEARSTDPRRLSSGLSGDLDAIVATALAADRERRYASAEQLAEDVRRHLEGLPVRARLPTPAYRVGKFVRRYAWQVAAAAAAAAFLVVFAVTMAVQRQQIALERDRAEAVTEYLIGLFEGGDPSHTRGAEYSLREVLRLGVEDLDARLENQPAIQATVLDAVGQVYDNLAEYDDAEVLLTRALDLRRAELGEGDPEVGETLQNLAEVLRHQNELDRVEPLLVEAVEIASEHDDGDDLRYPHALHNLGSFLIEHGGSAKEDGALQLLHEALDLKIRRLGPDDPDVAYTLAVLAQHDHRNGRLDAAEERFRRVLEIRRAEYGDRAHPDLSTALNNLAIVLEDRGNHVAARALYEESVAMRRELYGKRHPRYALALNNLASFLDSMGEPAAAVAPLEEAIDILQEVHGEDDWRVAVARRNLAAAHAGTGDYAACEREARAALEVLADPLANDPWRRPDAESVLGGCLAGLGRVEEAEPLLVQAVPSLTELLAPDAKTVEARERLEAFRSRGAAATP